MRFLIFGAGGQLGGCMTSLADRKGVLAAAFTHAEIDITDRDAVEAAIEKSRPTHVINAAAYNAVDKAEDEPEIAFAINANAPGMMAELSKAEGAVFVHYSTDYVFDGEKREGFTERDEVNPLSVYGRSKLEGERQVAASSDRHYVFRTAWVFAPGGNNFVSRLISKMETQREFRFIDDAYGTPTYAADLAEATWRAIEMDIPYGVYHAAGSQACTPYEWAVRVAGLAGKDVAIETAKLHDFATKAKRPRYSIIRNEKLRSCGIVIPNGLERTADYFRPGVGI